MHHWARERTLTFGYVFSGNLFHDVLTEPIMKLLNRRMNTTIICINCDISNYDISNYLDNLVV